MARKPKIDSIDAQVKIVSLSNVDIKPPNHIPLEDSDLPFFDSVICEFAKSEWTDHQLELAAMLARMMCDMEKEQRAMRKEGTVMFSKGGTPVVSPRKTVVQMLAGSILSMRRSLSLHARAQNGEPRESGAKRAIAKEIEKNASSLNNSDDLISYPLVN